MDAPIQPRALTDVVKCPFCGEWTLLGEIEFDAVECDHQILPAPAEETTE